MFSQFGLTMGVPSNSSLVVSFSLKVCFADVMSEVVLHSSHYDNYYICQVSCLYAYSLLNFSQKLYLFKCR